MRFFEQKTYVFLKCVVINFKTVDSKPLQNNNYSVESVRQSAFAKFA